jgi:hypothetical protein
MKQNPQILGDRPMTARVGLAPGAQAQTTAYRRLAQGLVGLALVALYLTSWHNYLLFHSLVELFSIVVAFSLFMVAWNSRAYIQNPYLLFVGIAYLFIGGLDLLHTLAYKGMPIFTDYDYYANQLWIAARYMESLTLLAAFGYLFTRRRPRTLVVFGAYSGITLVVVASIFIWKIFPECFSDATGLTPFKIISEYVICGILAGAILLLHHTRDAFEESVFRLLRWSLICTIVSELAFTFYVSNYGLSNLVGHYFKLASFYLVYRAVIQTGIRKPYELIFRELDRANHQLHAEVGARRKTEQEREDLIRSLQNALEEIQTLKGILPICMHCKRIRDDQGYWNQLEKYLHEHSGAEFSHGICPQCLQRHYPDLK